LNTTKKDSTVREIWHFFLHLRWHYQIFILSGGFLLGGFLSPEINWPIYLLQFVNVHLLLFGGATAYNSYWDKDKGPIGGLKHPPEMSSWMWFASLFLQVAGLFVAIFAGWMFVIIYLVSMLFFWLYSTPHARWKGTPVKSLTAIGISTGTNSVLLGYLAASQAGISLQVLSAGVGCAFIILSLYPVSQIYQLNEDRERGDQTFAVQYGRTGVLRFFEIAFNGGLILIVFGMINPHFRLSVAFFTVGFLAGLWVRQRIKTLAAEKNDYAMVMRIKFGVSLSFVVFLVMALLLKHTSVGILSGLDLLLK